MPLINLDTGNPEPDPRVRFIALYGTPPYTTPGESFVWTLLLVYHLASHTPRADGGGEVPNHYLHFAHDSFSDRFADRYACYLTLGATTLADLRESISDDDMLRIEGESDIHMKRATGARPHLFGGTR